MKISIVGAGRVGVSLAYLLSKNFEIEGIIDKNDEKIDRLKKQFHQAKYIGLDLITGIKNSDVIFITTQDDYIKQISDKIFSNNEIKDKYVFHCSGSLPSAILNSAKENGCFIGSIHPLQSVPDFEQGIKNLKKAYFCIEGDNEAIEVAKKIVNSISGKYFVIRTEYKSLYHLGAVFSSNFINTLVFITCEIFKKIGISEDYNKTIDIISPLINGSIDNILKLGVIKSLTGPVVRGDINTIKNHMYGLKDLMPELMPIYRQLITKTAELAELQITNLEIKNRVEKIKQLMLE